MSRNLEKWEINYLCDIIQEAKKQDLPIVSIAVSPGEIGVWFHKVDKEYAGLLITGMEKIVALWDFEEDDAPYHWVVSDHPIQTLPVTIGRMKSKIKTS